MKETHQAGIDTTYDGLSNGDDIAGVYIGHATGHAATAVERGNSIGEDYRREFLGAAARRWA